MTTRRSWFVAAIHSAVIATGCGSFGTGASDGGSPTAEGGITPPPPGADGGGEVTAPDASDDAGGGVRTCYDLTTGDNGFKTIGNTVIRTDTGFVFNVDPTERAIYRTFSSPLAKITTSQFEIDMTVVPQGTISSGWIDLVALYYGDPPTLYETAAQNITITKAAFEVNAWWAAGESNYDSPAKPLALFSFGAGPGNALIVATRWAPTNVDGYTKLSSGGTTRMTPVKTATITRNKVTLVIGGKSFNGAPTADFVVRSVCVTQN